MTSSISDIQIKALVATLDVVATLVSNVPLLVALATSHRLKKDVISRGMLSLAISDIGFGALYPTISSIVAWSGPNVPQPSILFGFQAFVFNIFSLSSIWHLALVSIIKCQIIVNPLTQFTERKMNVIICIVWVTYLAMTGLVSSLFFNYDFNWSVIKPIQMLRPIIFETFANFPLSLGYSLVFGWLCLTYMLPGMIMIGVYGKIFVVVAKQVRQIQSTTLGGAQRMDLPSSAKAAKRLFILYVAYMINYFPMFLTVVPGIAVSQWYVFIAHWLYQYSGALNASLYIALNRSVRHEIKRKFFFWRNRHNTFGGSQGEIS